MNLLHKTFLLIVPIYVLTISCIDSAQSNREKETAAIMKLHEAQRTYHFEKMSKEFASQLSDDILSLNRGTVSQSTFEENKARYDRYFNSVEFQKWDDTEEPIIRFSDDNSLAYTVVQKDVVINYPDENGEILRDSIHYAWQAVYRKNAQGEWKIEAVASTNSEVITTVQE